MRKGEQSKARMVAATAELLQRQGYHATGLKQIVETARAPKGSLYFHFPGGKEQLACEAIRSSGRDWHERLAAVVDGAPSPADAVLLATAYLADDLEQSSFENGCPVATVALETANQSEDVRSTCVEIYDGWRDLIRDRLAQFGVEGEVAEDAATFVLSAIEGALLLARVHHDADIVRNVGRQLYQLYRAG